MKPQVQKFLERHIMGMLDEVEILEGEGLKEYIRKRRLELLKVKI